MEFSPNNPIIQTCLQAIALKDQGKAQEAKELFLNAWKEAESDFEKFTVAYLIAMQEAETKDSIHWFELALKHALKAKSTSVETAMVSLYSNLAEAYLKVNDEDTSDKYRKLMNEAMSQNQDIGPFYHGTRADLNIGEHLTPGRKSNYKDNLTMNHIYFTAMISGAALAAAFAKGEAPERVYIVEPVGSFENDPNVTDKKFPGNPTRSYRTDAPLKIVGEAKEWERISEEELKVWREKLAKNKGEIIN